MRMVVPHMGHLDIAYARVLRRLGVDVLVPPRPSRRSLEIGSLFAPEFACLPFKMNLGNMKEALDLGATDIMTYGGKGPCRFGYYHCIQEEILKDLGYQFRMGATDEPDKLSSMLKTIGQIAGIDSKKKVYKIFFFMMRRLAAADYAHRLACRIRPKETVRGSTDRAYHEALELIDASRGFIDLWWTRKKVKQLFSRVKTKKVKNGIKVGLVGELFMVEEPFANFEIERKLGEAGVYVERGIYLSQWLNERFRFEPLARKETRYALELAKGYLHHTAGGESVISVGKSIDFARRGFDGVVHLMPFTCMPEIVAQSILTKVSRDFKLPVLTLIIDEHTSEVGFNTRLEAFIDLLRRRKKTIKKEGAFN